MAVIAAHVTVVFGTGTAAVDMSTADGTGMDAATVIGAATIVRGIARITAAPTIGVTTPHQGSTVTDGTTVRATAAVSA